MSPWQYKSLQGLLARMTDEPPHVGFALRMGRVIGESIVQAKLILKDKDLVQRLHQSTMQTVPDILYHISVGIWPIVPGPEGSTVAGKGFQAWQECPFV